MKETNNKHAPLYVLIPPSHLQSVTILDNVMQLPSINNASGLFLEGVKQGSSYCSLTDVLMQIKIITAEISIIFLHIRVYGLPLS
jgi:hypothetical protein